MNTKIIFIRAYSEYAFQGFELNGLDDLLKLITFQRFLNVVNTLQSKKTLKVDMTITVKSGYDLHKLQLNDITYIENDIEYID